MKGSLSIVIIVVLCVAAFTVLVTIVGPINLNEVNQTSESLQSSKARSDAQLLTGLYFVVSTRTTNDTQPSTPLILVHKNSERDFVPCTEEQKKLKAGDKVTFIYQAEALGSSDDPLVKVFCHLKIIRQ